MESGASAGQTVSSINGNPERQSNVEIKNGKVSFKQKPMSLEKMTETMQELVKFREFLEQRIENQQPPLSHVPDEHKPLIAKFTQESDKTIVALSKHIQRELTPTPNDGDMAQASSSASSLPLETIEATIRSVATRVNYGIELANLTRTPALLCIWRWEVQKDYYHWLPKASREKVEPRLAERILAKKELQTLFDALPQSERDAMLGTKGVGAVAKQKPKALFHATSNDLSPVRGSSPLTSPGKPIDSKVDLESAENDGAQTKPGPGRPKKAADPEKSAKERERLERKAAKADRERKEKEAQNKSRSLMASFFAKPKAFASTSINGSPSKEPVAGSSTSSTSDFAKAFRPFVLKKDAELAPINWFQESRRRQKREDEDVIVLDDDAGDAEDTVMHDAEVDLLQSPKCSSHCRSLVSSLPLPLDSSRLLRRPSSQFKVYHPDPVRSIIARLSEAELSDDTAAVRELLADLQDRKRLPAKVLIFEEDRRPGYFGTFTRSSQAIGPRTPFTRDDVVVDYSYDSGEEWGEEEEGGGDDVAEASDEDGDDEDGSSDLDDWLVDEDQEEVATPIDEREGMDGFPFPPPPEQAKGKRKAEVKEKGEGTDATRNKKRKAVVPLVPLVKGPFWETKMGKCEYEPFNQYRIQLFNDTPYPIDPFTFVSTPFEKQVVKPAPSTSTSVLASSSVPIFAVPALPSHFAANCNPPSTTSPLAVSTPKRALISPKNPFPDTHLPFLVSKIAALATSSLPALVDSVYQDLKVHKVKKNAIEVKVREICEKDQRRVWVVKKGLHAPNGLTVSA